MISKDIKKDKLIIKNKNEYIFIPLNHIFFIETVDKKTLIHTKSNSYLIMKSLSEVQKELPYDFIRVHRSFIINKEKINKIVEIGNKAFEIKFYDTNKIALMSRNKFYELKNNFITFK